MRIDIDVDVSGPFFDGRALRALRDYVDEMPYEVAGVGVDVMVDRFRQRVQNPTPYYEYLITRERRGYGEAVVWDGGEVEYGPWLAGRGSRSYPVTRFRGYDHLDHAYEQLQQRGADIAEDVLRDRFLPRMN